ncbi:family 10 glycosylhydrolase [Planktothricoides raciborskii]|uniref:Family 10 glycosylhydrolase n=2 Tax=Planktothricoides raciborskii TaxID=132608 RepID=A0AAU8JKI1_9CYAN|nr:family 10 glycosylhydrolase [Planktothricoides raciborskii]MBD2544421.1 family 10 glycosylhydrolase [Planktothricoides raciborskii FACHB-1370]MBD2585514.1 family 10 glycosylhydrolase [Planktothricoides raciborskii FACHB-1261]
MKNQEKIVKKKPSGCGCSNIPISIILIFIGGGYWLFTHQKDFLTNQLFALVQQIPIPEEVQPFLADITANIPTAKPSEKTPESQTATQTQSPPQILANDPQPNAEKQPKTIHKKAVNPQAGTTWESKIIRGVYISRYAITNNTDEKTIRERVRYYHSQGINTIIHGVWGNACTMYNSQVMQKTLGYESCPNEFQDRWLDWLIDEAHKHGMQVHAYFEKGIKIDENSPVFDLAVARKWIVPGVDRTHPGVDHYVLDVEIPEVGEFFKDILVEFVKKYPKIDAVQWDDYLGYYAELPGKVDRTASLTKFVEEMIAEMKKANPAVSFDLCHHNPYWAKQYFAADWENWSVDRVFIQVYSEENFAQELGYVKQSNGIAITERQFQHLESLVKDPEVQSILIFPLSGKPEEAIAQVKKITDKF